MCVYMYMSTVSLVWNGWLGACVRVCVCVYTCTYLMCHLLGAVEVRVKSALWFAQVPSGSRGVSTHMCFHVCFIDVG